VVVRLRLMLAAVAPWLLDVLVAYAVTSFGHERCHVSFSSNSIIPIFIMLLLCFHMLSLCFHYVFLGTRLIKVSFFGDVTYLRTIFQILLVIQCGAPIGL
jgi:hypothetical protein